MADNRLIEARPDGRGARFCIVASRYNPQIVDNLIDGALRALRGHGAPGADIVRVPGAFEIPLAASRCADAGRYAGIVAVGCVIRGQTPHFDHVVRECSRGIARVMLDTGVPVGFGVLAADNAEQAMARAGADRNRGAEAALAALEMACLLRRLG